ncbi:MerR family transcriptional regulator [Actinopolymorpha alba]|uniref:MerR family transcriptional regulator n=1 Tax=Actinopolymorpha alba TaxID=533267 RepID=UPI00035F5619|nr:MerR family transcriptional regulator [Actinopolymorpha alba]
MINEPPDVATCRVDELTPDVDEPLTVGQVAALTGLSTHTLRWYERVGLLEGVARDGSGHRRYTEVDLRRLVLLMRLRATGMPVSEMLRYAELLRADTPTELQRMQLLEAHRDRVLNHIADLHRDLDVINSKITGYRRALSPAVPA